MNSSQLMSDIVFYVLVFIVMASLALMIKLGPSWDRRAKAALERWLSKHSYKAIRISLVKLAHPWLHVRFGFESRSLFEFAYRVEFANARGKIGRAIVLVGTDWRGTFEDQVQIKWEVNPDSDPELQGDSELR